VEASVLADTTAPASIGRARGVVVVTREDGSTLAEKCVVADRMLARMKGLLGRRGLANGEAMLIRPAPSIHTFFMRFAIDAVFLSSSGDVLKVAPSIKPWRTRSCRRSYAVLELAAGEACRRDISPGDQLLFTEASR
jgi:uncharacterized membrane protein (UPF0127 family)